MKRRLFILATFMIATAITAIAQTSRGSVSGLVSDPTGAVVPGATITLTNDLTNVARSTSTTSEGFYRFDAVDLGTYTIKIAAAGFGDLTKTKIIVTANQAAQIDAQLAPSGQNISVDVTAEAGAVLQTETPLRGGNIESQRITELPIATRNPVALALTLPGVASNRGGFGIGTFSVNGARGRSNNFMIDGVANNDLGVAGQGLQITNPDAVQEVAVQTSNFDAEFGRAGGGVINVITKAGTNNYHGTLSYFLDSTRDDALTSLQSFAPANVQRGRPPFGIQNIFSGTFGGPIIRNRTFIFGAYQEDRQRSNGQTTLITPTASGRDALRRLFPAGVNANVDLLLNLTQNAVANSGPFGIALGAATVGGADRGSIEFGNFARSFTNNRVNRQWQVRMDDKLSERDQLSGSIVTDRTNQPLGGITELAGFDADITSRYYNFILSETHVFSATLTNEARIAYNRIDFGFPLSDPNGPAGQLPRITIAQISPLGASTTFPQGRVANNYTLQDTMTWVRGNHTIRGGFESVRQIATDVAPYNPRGAVTFAITSSLNYSAFANFVDNIGGDTNIGNATRDIGSAVSNPNLFRTAAFAQDRWRVNNGLTVTLGLRYEYFGKPFNTLRTPAFTDLFNVNPATLTGPFSEPNQVRGDWNNWGPTIGIAWSPSVTRGLLGRLIGENKTSIRAGYQIGYDAFFTNITANAATSPPNLITTQFFSTRTTANPRGTPNFLAQIPSAAGAALTSFSPQTLIQQDLVNPYYQRWSLGIQRELPSQMLLDVSYVGSKGTKLYINEDWNPFVPANLRVTPTGYTGAISGRLDSLQGGRTVRTNGGYSNFHSGQIGLTRRFSNNLSLTGSYTYSKLLDNQSEVFAPGGANATSFFAVSHLLGGGLNERGPSTLDRTHRAVFSWVYSLPFAREQRGILGRALGGWQISGVTTFESGLPFTVFNGVDTDGISGALERVGFNPDGQAGVRARPNVSSAANPGPGGITDGSVYYTNPDDLSRTLNGRPVEAYIDPRNARYVINPTVGLNAPGIVRFSPIGRNSERSPGTNIFNMNFQKATRINERMQVEFRSELFNIFNHPNYGQGSISPFSPGATAIQSNASTATSGRYLKANTPQTDGGGRVVRFQLKLSF